MNKKAKYLQKLLEFVKSDSILVINSSNEIRRIYCPFNVMVIRIIPEYMIGDIAVVEAVKITIELENVYIIRGKAYYIWNFRIITNIE